MDDRRTRTRKRLSASALKLFAEHGYEATTVAQIAADAGVTEMTFFRHFSSKADVLLDDPYDPLVAAAVAREPLGLDPVTRVVRGVQATWRTIPEGGGEEIKKRVRIAAQTPSLRAAMWQNTAQTERVLVDQLIGDGVDRLAAKVAVAAVLAGVTAALLEWAGSEAEDLRPAMQTAFDVLEAAHA
ncbi:MAG: TetR/AcrR family transcriptional regulator [Actinomycetota bacterium]|nr:TetR/AcrR family transcriptional regulator [Actinomycetota bacterium]